MDAAELHHIAHNDIYFGLGGALDTKQRAEYLSQDSMMRSNDSSHMSLFEETATQVIGGNPSKELSGQINESDGFEYLEYPSGSGEWFYRNRSTGEWMEWTH
jgi:hypothetical protein